MKKNNKKDGFSLAELLICITLMAVIAVLSISMMLSGYEKRSRKAYFTKVYSEIVTAMFNASKDSCNAEECEGETDKALDTLMENYMTILSRSHANITIGSQNNDVLELADGTFILVPTGITSCSTDWNSSFEGTPPASSCAVLYVDVNGDKEPNKLWTNDLDEKAKKNYEFDRMPLYLYKSTVMFPAGAKYVFKN